MPDSVTKAPVVWGVDYFDTSDNSTGTKRFVNLESAFRWVTNREAQFGRQSVIRIRRLS